MTTEKTTAAAKKTAVNQAPATAKQAAKPVVKPAAKKNRGNAEIGSEKT